MARTADKRGKRTRHSPQASQRRGDVASQPTRKEGSSVNISAREEEGEDDKRSKQRHQTSQREGDAKSQPDRIDHRPQNLDEEEGRRKWQEE